MALDRKQEAEKLFALFDLNKDGKLTGNELKYFVAGHFYKAAQFISKSQVRKVLRLTRKADPTADPNEQIEELALSQSRFVQYFLNSRIKNANDDEFFGYLSVLQQFAEELSKYGEYEEDAASESDSSDESDEEEEEEEKKQD